MSQIKVSLRGGQSIDDALLQAAVLGLSAEETSTRIGGVLSPARVMIRTREMLAGGNWLEDAERERAILRLLEKNLIDLNNQYLDMDNAKVQLAYAKELFDRLDKRKAATETDLNTYDENVGRQMGHVVDVVFAYVGGRVIGRTEPITPEEWRELLEEGMEMARYEIGTKQVEASGRA